MHLDRNKRILWSIERTSLTPKIKVLKWLKIWQNYRFRAVLYKLFTKSMKLFTKSRLKIRVNIKQTESSRTEKTFFSSYIDSSIFSTNPNNMKLQMLQKGLKCDQLEGNTIYTIQREFPINNHKVDNGLNEAVIRNN